MVSASFFVSALFALTAVVYAAPAVLNGVADVYTPGHLGLGELFVDQVAQDVIAAHDVEVEDNGNDIDIF